MTDTTAPQASFLIALPPGWMRLPARPGEAAVLRSLIDEIVDEALPSTLPRDKAEPWRGEMRKTITGVVTEARDAGANAVYLPVRPVNGINVPASFVESEVDDGSVGDPGALLAAILTDADNGALHMIDGAHAARTDSSVVRVEPRDGWPGMTTRQIVYTIEVPHREGRWIVMSFSAATGDQPGAALSDALVQLFDALMLTFRWSEVPGADHSDLEERLAQIHSQ